MRQITIIGTGLMGGSLALGLKKRGFGGRVVGCDRAGVLAEAQDRGAIDAGFEDARRACEGSDVVVLATPVGGIIDLIERLGPVLATDTLLTDVGSTKAEILARARQVFGDQAAQRFLAGHPMAGKEVGGMAHADPDLFAGAVWLITPVPGQDNELCGEGPATKIRELAGWISRLGARIISMDAARHDRLCAWISHLPQMLSTALAATLEAEVGDDLELHAIGGRALREMTRLAQSPYAMWRDIALTNTANLQEALLQLEQRLAHLRENLRTRELESEFERAARFKQF
jgi:prephenate dehydrogenase